MTKSLPCGCALSNARGYWKYTTMCARHEKIRREEFSRLLPLAQRPKEKP